MNEEKKLNAEALDQVAGGGTGTGQTCRDCKNSGSILTCPCWTNAEAVSAVGDGTHELCIAFEPKW